MSSPRTEAGRLLLDAFIEALGSERSAGAAPLDVLDRIRAQIPSPPSHVHEHGCGHDGEGVTPEYQRGWSAGRRYDNEQVRAILDDLVAEYARLSSSEPPVGEERPPTPDESPPGGSGPVQGSEGPS